MRAQIEKRLSAVEEAVLARQGELAARAWRGLLAGEVGTVAEGEALAWVLSDPARYGPKRLDGRMTW